MLKYEEKYNQLINDSFFKERKVIILRIYRAKDYKDMSRKTANVISAQIIMKPDCVLGLTTGSTPVGAYKQLIEWYNKGDLNFAEVTSVNLDEYKGLSRDNDQSYYYFMQENLFKHVNINQECTFIPDGTIENSQAACDNYNEIIYSLGRVDLQLLGIGLNGHIGFNEPSEYFEKETHCVNLAPSTIEANSRFFASKEEVPIDSVYHGHQDNYERKDNIACCKRKRKIRYYQRSFLRSYYTKGSCFYPPNAS
ncbi:glucosamine-6-phosphate isomerase [Holotrichia oblita]|nr:glucosamine-6-phosphate isomerase [Holotrichia oblita]